MKAEFALDYTVIAVERAQHVYLMARIEAEASSLPVVRHPLNLSVVVDRSGSMQGNKLEYVKQAAQYLIQRIAGNDRFSLVTYDHTVRVDVPPISTLEKDRVNQVIQKLQAGGGTNLSGGWLQGCQLVAAHITDGQVNRVLLLTDGHANEGVTDPARLEALARQKRSEGITTTTMGVGMGFNEDLLLRMAKEGGGAFYFIDNPDQAAMIFNEELNLIMSVIGQNLMITLTLTPEVTMARQLSGYPFTTNVDGATFRMGDLFAQEQKSLMLELSIPALKTLGEVEVARLRFEYDELGEDSVTHRTIELPIKVNTVTVDDFEKQVRDPEVVKMALLMQAARAREEAIKHADAGDFEQASQVLGQTANLIRESKIPDSDLRQQHDMLREEAVDMDLGAERYTAYERKAHATKSFNTETRPFSAAASASMSSLHSRMKETRRSLERHGPPPARITWADGSRPIGEQLRFGRAEDNDIVINEDPVSAHHCEIVRRGNDVILRDLNSTNGTFANGGRMTGEFRLSVGDVMTVGTVLFMFEGDA